MDKRELRVGNWVNDKEGNPIKVLAIGYQVIKVLDRNGVLFEDAKPILINDPGLLEKLGLLKSGDVLKFKKELQKEFEIPGIQFILKEDYLSIQANQHILDEENEITICEYLHEFQNIYFALTNIELPVNL